jgi:hypothetical protein
MKENISFGNYDIFNFEKAKQLCENLGGYRLPTIEELKTIYDRKDVLKNIHIAYPTINTQFWSSTESKALSTSENKCHSTINVQTGELTDCTYDSSNGISAFAVKEF